ncbi:helix-turn-helix transcriptional regulator [Prauserella flavalba]|uniref:helix-turn-helix transcriptional regulator n=1 Tax=Prauserella flavalba TaxID=1477506 RepID=UPI0036E1A6F9
MAGLRLLHENRADLAEAPVPRQLAAMAMVLEHQCALNLAQFPLAREVAEWGAHRLGPTAEGHLTVARTRFARGDLDGTERALVAAREPGVPQLVPGTKAELDLLEAAAALRLDCRTKARSALDRALALAAPGRTIRPFAHVEPDVRRLLLDQTGGFGDAESFAAEVRHTFAAAGADLAATVLTGRERAVLVRLAASPQPLDEVASTLRVSVNTVKTHVRAIYAKLGVNNRRAAIVAARELGFG